MENNTIPIPNTTTLPSAFFPVTFYDGETELNMGTVQITPSLTFKAFQSIISQKLHISPHQITIYFQNHNPTSQFHHHYNNHHRRRHPVTSKFDFSSICNNDSINSCFFWVVQKRSRRTRRRKNHNNINNNTLNNGFVGFGNNNNYTGENFSILRRGELLYGVNDLDYRMGLLELERERYLMSMNLNSNVYNDLSFDGYFNGGGGYNCNFSDDGASYSSGGASSVGYCDVCYRGDAETVPFHSCKNDAVTKVFRSPAGPIARPKKFDFLG